MLDPKYVLSNIDVVRQSIKDRNMDVDISHLQRVAAERADLLREQDRLRHRRNELAKRRVADPADPAHVEGRQIKERIAEMDGHLRDIEERYFHLLHQIPNVIHPDCPRGSDERDCKLLSTWGAPSQFDFKPKDHVRLGAELDLFDFERAAVVSGAKFYYLKNAAVLLEIALVRYAIDMAVNRGYRLYVTPDIVRHDISTALGFHPRGNESNVYSVADSDLCLIGTSEITLGAYHYRQRIAADQLPIRMVGLSHCFRREAGAAGKRDRGLFRVHQFTKAELFIVGQPEDGEALHQELLDLERDIFIGLEVPFRVLDVCSGDLGAPAYRKFDIEAWMPGKENDDGSRGSWGEVTSASNCTDYQSRRLETKTIDRAGTSRFAYMLNGTAIATTRAMIAVLENHQRADGTVRIPDALQPYTGFKIIERQ